VVSVNSGIGLSLVCMSLQLVLKYFADMDRPMDLLSKQLWLIVQRTIISVRMEPKIIVTVLRIIEREERCGTMSVVLMFNAL